MIFVFFGGGILTAKGVNGGKMMGGKIFSVVDGGKCSGGEEVVKIKIIDDGGLVASNKGKVRN